MRSYLYIAAALGLIGLVTYGYALQASNARLRVENGRLEQSLRVAEEIAQRNAEARDVARAETIRFQREIDQRYKPLIEDILRSDTNEIPAHPSTIAVIERLRRVAP